MYQQIRILYRWCEEPLENIDGLLEGINQEAERVGESLTDDPVSIKDRENIDALMHTESIDNRLTD